MSPRAMRWTARAVLYGLLAVLALVALAMRDGEQAQRLSGRTSQRVPFFLDATDHGVVTHISTDLRARCDDGQTFTIHWGAYDRAPVPFVRDGERLRIHETWEYDREDGWHETGSATLDGRVAGDGRSASGVIAASMTLTNGHTVWGSCRASGVRFRAAR